MNVRSFGNAVALAGACALASPALAIQFWVHEGNESPAFASGGDKEGAGFKPWQAYSDPSCDRVDVASMSFDTTVYGARPTEHPLDKPHEGYGEGPKYPFNKDDKYDVSHFHGYGHHAHWKPDPGGDYCTPVPEPQTYALLLAGLGVLTVVARRRKLAVQ